MGKQAISDGRITRAGCRHAVKTLYASWDTGIGMDEQTLNKLQAKVRSCRLQYDDFFDFNITNNRLEKLSKLDRDSKFYVSGARNAA